MYRVINWEDGADEEMIAGLTIEEAAKQRLRLSSIRHEFRLLDGDDTLTLFMAPRRTSLSDLGGQLVAVRKATYRDRKSAEAELYQWVADAALPGPYIVVTDLEFERSKQQFDESDDDTGRFIANERQQTMADSRRAK